MEEVPHVRRWRQSVVTEERLTVGLKLLMVVQCVVEGGDVLHSEPQGGDLRQLLTAALLHVHMRDDSPQRLERLVDLPHATSLACVGCLTPVLAQGHGLRLALVPRGTPPLLGLRRGFVLITLPCRSGSQRVALQCGGQVVVGVRTPALGGHIHYYSHTYNKSLFCQNDLDITIVVNIFTERPAHFNVFLNKLRYFSFTRFSYLYYKLYHDLVFFVAKNKKVSHISLIMMLELATYVSSVKLANL